MERYSPHEYDAITIFNSDNKVVPNALELFNNAYYSGCDAIQAHRMTENLNTNIAVLNATSEEINNHLFRKAHTALGCLILRCSRKSLPDYQEAIWPKLQKWNF